LVTHFNGNVTVNGILGGTDGARAFTLTSGKTLSIGAGGNITLATAQALTLDAASFAILGIASDTSFASINGAVVYGGTLTFDLNTTANSVWAVFTNSGAHASDNFTSVLLTGTGYGNVTLTNLAGVWTGTSGATTFTFDGPQGTLTAAVPEPSTYLLIVCGLATVMIFGRGRPQRAASR
jgi:hypothetical protein